MIAKILFFNENGRLRSGFRFTIFLLAYFFLVTLIGGGILGILQSLPIGFTPNSLLSYIVSFGISAILAIVVGWLCGKYLEDLPFRALGCWFTKNWFKDLILGLVLGAVSIGFAVFISFLFGGLNFQFNQSVGSSAILLTLGVSLIVFIVGAAFEELFFRGYMLQTFARANLAWLAIFLTSLFFAAVHTGNPNSTTIATFNTALAGIWFGVAYLKTRNLWFVFGLHLTWNWFQGAIFGIEVSGLTDLTTAPLLKEIDAGPVWLTGGDYGIEGGLPSTIALILSTVLIYFSPVLRPTEEMLALTSEEMPKNTEGI